MSTRIAKGMFLLVVLFGLLQIVPYGHNHTNPPVLQEPKWDSPQTRTLVKRACFDCHSNETTWPWYSHIAPISWLVQRDVEVGRRKLNFSEWNRAQEGAREMIETVREGEMPPLQYWLIQSKARLSPAEKEALVRGLMATLQQSRFPSGARQGKAQDD